MEKSDRLKAHELDLERHARGGVIGRVILGGQDGLVNVLGVLLGVATATSDPRVVVIAGVAAAVTESVSMLAVAYTSARADEDFYRAQLEREEREIREMPEIEREEVRHIYFKKGFRGEELERVVAQITSDPAIWRDVMMREELGLEEVKMGAARRDALIVGASVITGSIFPLMPFLVALPRVGWFDLRTAMELSSGMSLAALFSAGWLKAGLTTGSRWMSGFEMAVVGGVACLIGYGIGRLLGVAV
ncbi:MAG: VIT1/CCC1 transporter family protein [Planctomycetes bacterium]|nr:VIT1/CCC1 transporter family protein [Planctomycetota bacterium]